MRLQWPKGASIKAVNPYYYANGNFCRKIKFFQGTNRCYDKAVAGEWFSLRDLMGGECFAIPVLDFSFAFKRYPVNIDNFLQKVFVRFRFYGNLLKKSL